VHSQMRNKGDAAARYPSARLGSRRGEERMVETLRL
jgi:hypothetical protein